MMDVCSLPFCEKYLYHLHPKYSVIQAVSGLQRLDPSLEDPYASNDRTVIHGPLWMMPIPSGSSLLLPSFLPPFDPQPRFRQCSTTKEKPSISQHIQKRVKIEKAG